MALAGSLLDGTIAAWGSIIINASKIVMNGIGYFASSWYGPIRLSSTPHRFSTGVGVGRCCWFGCTSVNPSSSMGVVGATVLDVWAAAAIPVLRAVDDPRPGVT